MYLLFILANTIFLIESIVSIFLKKLLLLKQVF
jgi:hypothetical protein